jgi:hypothetical protein
MSQYPLYLQLGSLLSIYGCYQYVYNTGGDRYDLVRSGADHGTYMIAPTAESAYDPTIKISHDTKTNNGREIAGVWGYMFQIMFQVSIIISMCRRFTFSQKVDMFFINKSNREKQER